MRRLKLYRLPVLHNAGGDLSKPWWVEIAYRDPRDGKMVRKRYKSGFSELKTRKARNVHAEKLIKDLTERLVAGWNPLDDVEQVAYVDELEYHQAAQVYGRKRESIKNIHFYGSEYITLMKNTKAKKPLNHTAERSGSSSLGWKRRSCQKMTCQPSTAMYCCDSLTI